MGKKLRTYSRPASASLQRAPQDELIWNLRWRTLGPVAVLPGQGYSPHVSSDCVPQKVVVMAPWQVRRVFAVASLVMISLVQVSTPSGAVGHKGGLAASLAALPQLGPTSTLIGQPFYGQRGTFFMFQCNDPNSVQNCGASTPEILVVNNDGITGSGANGIQTVLATPFYGQRGTYADSLSDQLFAVNDDGIYVKRWIDTSWPDDGSLGPTVRATTGPFYGNLTTAFADVNGDDRPDAIAVNRDGVFIKPAQPDGTFGATQRWTSTRAFGSRGTYFAKVNGDSKADLIMVNAGGTTVRMSTGSGFAPNGPVQPDLTAASNLAFGTVGYSQGLAAVWFSPTRVYAFPATGAGFAERQAVTSGPYYGQLESALTPWDGGRTDPYHYLAVVINRSGIYAKG